MSRISAGLISVDEAYSKSELMKRLGISQRSWDKMLDAGLSYTNIGHARWGIGKDVIEYMTKHSKGRPTDTSRGSL